MNRLFDLPSQGEEKWGTVPGWPRYSVSTHDGALRDVMSEVGREQTFGQVQEWIAAHGKP